ncbi:MAG: hypothetical protein ACREU0_01715 [Burkholderiales bacterium]
MAAIRSASDIAKKWAEVAPGRAGQYEMGVKNPVRDYAANAQAANEAWKSGTQAAIAGDRFKRGVAKVGTAKWQERAVKLGPSRYGPGVQAAVADYESGFAPYREAIAGAALPPRGPRRSPQNLQRVNAMVTAIANRKEALLKGA